MDEPKGQQTDWVEWKIRHTWTDYPYRNSNNTFAYVTPINILLIEMYIEMCCIYVNGAWSWPLTSLSAKVKKAWSFRATLSNFCMAWCLRMGTTLHCYLLSIRTWWHEKIYSAFGFITRMNYLHYALKFLIQGMKYLRCPLHCNNYKYDNSVNIWCWPHTLKMKYTSENWSQKWANICIIIVINCSFC
jgi:hypothetical protein